MTVATTTYFVNALGNGATTVFNFNFIADSAATMEVFYVAADLSQTLLSPSQYTLYINPPAVGQLWGVGGTVTYPLSGSPIASGTSLIIQRIVPYLQTVSISNQGAFYPQAVEQALDLLELQIQQLLAGGTGGGTGGGLDTAAKIPFEFLGGVPPVTNEVMGLISFPVQTSFSCNFAGATGKCLVNPTGTVTANITKNGSVIGHMVISTSGVFTFTTVTCATLVYAVGDYMSIVAPSGVDATLANLAWSFIGVMN